MELIIHELRGKKPIEPSTTNTVEDIIEFEGQQYKKVDRLARKGDVITPTKGHSAFLTQGKMHKVVEDGRVIDNYGHDIPLYTGWEGRTPETVDVYELIEPTLTPNQQRAAIIEKAKELIESTKKTWSGLVVSGSLKGQNHTVENVYQVILGQISPFRTRVAACNVEFVINEDKRTIVALMRSIESPKIYARGIAKCDPNDVFNEHIGKAIALGRALGLDVSEFEQAVQPNEVVMGMNLEVRTNGEVDFTHKPINTDDLFQCNHDFQKEESGVFIINDTNAKYEVSSNE